MEENPILEELSLTTETLETGIDSITLETPPSIPALTLEADKPSEEIPPAQNITASITALQENLTPEEIRAVNEFSQKIDLKNATHVLQYGVSSQKKMVQFSEATLETVKGKDLGDIGQMINSLVVELKDFDKADERKGIFGLFKKAERKANQLQVEFSSVEKNVERISQELENHRIQLLKDIALLDKMYERNLTYYKELTLYILAGKKKIQEAEEIELPALQEKAKQSGLQQDAQAVNDFKQQLNRFDKKLYDLELTRNISIQMGPQIHLVQNNDAIMVEKIQTSILNTIPLWKNQMVLTLGLENSAKALQAQRAVTDTTNALLKANADKLKMSTIETAKEAERGIVDIETLQHTNQSLIDTLDEVLNIQQEGFHKRRAAEQELQRIENQLKDKLLDIRDRTEAFTE